MPFSAGHHFVNATLLDPALVVLCSPIINSK